MHKTSPQSRRLWICLAPVLLAACGVDRIPPSDSVLTANALSPDRVETAFAATVVTLGDPAEEGLWIKTRLVRQDTEGRVITRTGRTLALTLRPLDEGETGPAQISAAALAELDLPLAGLAPVTIAVMP